MREAQNRRASKSDTPVEKNFHPLSEAAGREAQGSSDNVNAQEETGLVPETRGQDVLVRRPLPTLRELLPPVRLFPSQGQAKNDGRIRLDSRETKYLSYFARIKRAIELVWEYPGPALQQGLEGKLVLEFAILGDGRLEKAHLIRSSGSPILDEEAIRAVRAASPFHPIPVGIGRDRLEIIASFEYLDNRLRYGFVP